MEWTRGPIIGRGSTATVSLATSTFSGELFALKSTELSKSMFLQKEQYLLSKLSSPYVVKYIGYHITSENNKPMYNICMEYVAGGTLHDEIQRNGGQLNEPLIRSYTKNILQGLDYLHTNGLAHCDIKSKNILLSKEGAKIADFGCARFVERPMLSFSGTPAFMAPEVARGEEQGFQADLWAVGCTIIEMATGKIPWETEQENDPVSVLYKIGFSSDLPEFPMWLSEKGKDFLRKCLNRDPKERWTAKELLDHPFLDDEFELELKKVEDFTMSSTSPSCVLDQDFWDSMEELESPQDLTLDYQENSNSISNWNLNSPADRIKQLIGCTLDEPNWTWEDDWITVRNSEIEKDEILADTTSVSSAFLILDSVIYEQEIESSISYEDLLLEFFVENDKISSSINNVSTSEEYDFVIENLNFESDSDKSCFLQSHFFAFSSYYSLVLFVLFVKFEYHTNTIPLQFYFWVKYNIKRNELLKFESLIFHTYYETNILSLKN